jgi:hypothetical protein
MNLYRGGAWKCQAFKDSPAFFTNKPPCRFHRFMQWLFFGFRWTRE